MAALRVFATLAITAVLVRTALGKNYVVSGASGRGLGTNLQAWASAQSFTTGDSITFMYGSLHNVVEASKAEFDACSMSNPIQTSTGRNTVIKLSNPGKSYFICGIPGHCSNGMKVEINTLSFEAPFMTPFAINFSTFPPIVAPSPSKTPVTDLSETAPTPQESSAVDCFSLMVKIGLHLATIIMMVLAF